MHSLMGWLYKAKGHRVASLILASGSVTRQKMLTNAGVEFTVNPAKIDEPAIIASLAAEQAKPRDIADVLAEYKAQRVAMKYPDSLVLGSDQVLTSEGAIFQKPNNLQEAKETLQKLRGKPHQLLSAAVVFENGQPAWRHIGRAQLVMRDFSDDFIDDYIATSGDDLLQCVGCYMLEQKGAQLFSHIQGDYFTILGLPLLEVLGFLRTRGVLQN